MMICGLLIALVVYVVAFTYIVYKSSQDLKK